MCEINGGLYVIETCITFCGSFTILGVFTEKKLFNPISIITFLWGMIIYLSSLKLYTLYEVREEVYKWILIGLIAFVVGYYVIRLLTKNGKVGIRFRSKNYTMDKVVTLNYKRTYALFALCIFYILTRISKYGAAIINAGFNLAALGSIISEGDIGDTGVINAIGFLIVTPLYLPLTIAFTTDFWMGRRDKVLIILTVFMTLGRIIIYGGRQPIIQLFIVMIICFTFSIGKYKDDFYSRARAVRNKKGILPTIIVGIIAFGYLTLTKTNAAIKTLYLDFAMQPYMFQFWADAIREEYAYGFASMFGFVHPILYIFKNFFRVFADIPYFFSHIYERIQDTFQNWIYIGKILKANAYSSSFWYMYYDGREIGIAIGMFIWGIASFFSFVKAKKQRTVLNIANYAMWAVGLIYTFTDMEFYKASYVLGFFYINLALYKRKIKQ